MNSSKNKLNSKKKLPNISLLKTQPKPSKKFKENPSPSHVLYFFHEVLCICCFLSLSSNIKLLLMRPLQTTLQKHQTQRTNQAKMKLFLISMAIAENLEDVGYLGMLLLCQVILTAYNQTVILFHQPITYLTTVWCLDKSNYVSFMVEDT